MPAIRKIEQVDQVAKKLADAKSVALIQYQGLNAGDIAQLRADIRAQGGQMEVVKNSLITRALAKIGIKLPETLTGPTSITYCNEDEVAPLKEIDKVNKAKEITAFKYGIFDKKLLSLDELKTFLSLPSKSTLISQFVGGLVNPLQRLVYAMRFNQTQLVLTLKALSEKQSQ
ncbi:MAG: 50S ribosomal protein L10 [Candidatus Shapirobacteria bacterium]